MPTKHRSKKTEALITRWTKQQKRSMERKAYGLGMSMNEFIERKVFDLPLKKNPAELE